MTSGWAVISKVGDFIEWETIGGDVYRGVILEIEEGTAVVLCEDGVRRAVEL